MIRRALFQPDTRASGVFSVSLYFFAVLVVPDNALSNKLNFRLRRYDTGMPT